MSKRITVDVRFHTPEGTLRLRARVTPGSETHRAVLKKIEYLSRHEHAFRTQKTVLVG